MVVIECPHCDEEIEMDDGAFGLFECPYCEGEYEWGEPPKKKIRTTTKSKRTTTKSKRTTTKSKLESRTRTTMTRSRINTTRQRTSKKTKQSFSGVQFTALIGNILLIFVLVSGLNSGSWYSYSIDDEDYDRRVEADFGLSRVTTTITEYEKSTGDLENPSETYESVRGSVSHYESSAKYAKINKKIIERECNDYNAYGWGETEEEYDIRCSELESMAQDSIDWWSGWESSSTILLFLLWLGIIFSSCVLFFNGLKLMEQIGAADSKFSLNRNYAKIQSLVEMIFYTIMILGLFLYMLFIPSLDLIYGRDDIPDELSSGMGLIWWISVITLIGSLIIAIVESSRIKHRFQ